MLYSLRKMEAPPNLHSTAVANVVVHDEETQNSAPFLSSRVEVADLNEQDLSLDRVHQTDKPSDDLDVTQYPGFRLESVLPHSWKALLDDRGRIVWKWENTLAVRLFGRRRVRPFLRFITRTRFHANAWFGVPLICAILSTIGVFKVVPKELFIASVCIYCVWQLWRLTCTVDLIILSKVCMNFANFATMAFVIFGQVCFGIMVDWDYRGVFWLIGVVTLAFVCMMCEAEPMWLRAQFVSAQTLGISRIAVTSILLNLLLIPDLDVRKTFAMVHLSETISVEISALGLYNQASVAVVILMCRNALGFYFSPNQLPSLTITLYGVDDPEAEQFNPF